MNGWNDTVRRRRMLILPALIVFLASVLFGMAPSAAETERETREVFVGDATIIVTWEDWGATYPAYGILDGLVSLADGSASLTPDLKSLTVVAPSPAPADDGEAALTWEEAAPLLARALALRDEVDPVLPGGDMDVIQVGDHSLFVPPALITSARLASVGLLDKFAKRRSVRRKLYAAAALRAVTLEEAQRFDEMLNDDLAALQSGAVTMLGATNYVASSGLDIYTLLRIIAGKQAAAAHGASTAAVAAKVTQRVSASALGKSVKGLGVLAFAVDLAEGISDSRARQRLAAAAADALLIASLDDARRLLEAEDADPAMTEGLADAIGQLTAVSQTRLEEYAETAGDALAGSLPSLAAAVVTYLGTGGAALVVREVAELGKELIGYTKEVLTVSAMATLGHVLRPRIEALVVGDEIGGSTADAYAMRELVTLHDRLGAEATATVYNMLWSERWRNSSSLAGIAKGAGLTLAEWLTADAGTQEVYRDEAAWRVRRVREGAAFAAALPQLLGELQDRYVGPPEEVAEAANDGEGTAADRIAPEWRVLFSEDFESYDVGSRPAHYIIVHNGLGTSEQRIEAEGGNRHLRTAGQRSWSLHMREDFDFDLPDALSVSWRMRVDKDLDWYSYTRPNGARYAHLGSFSVKNADEVAANISINKHETDRKIAAWCPEGDGKEFELQLGVWTEFRADVDFANGRQLRYANGELFCDTATSFVDLSGRWNSWGEAPGIRFGSGNSGTSITRFDDIAIRAIGGDGPGESAAPEAPATPSIDCAGWDSDDRELLESFYTDITPEDVAACLEAGADPNAQGRLERTPLHVTASFNDDPAVTQALVDAGARVSARDKFDLVPLHFGAAYSRNPAVIAALLEAGADADARDVGEQTPLNWAASSSDNPAIIAALLDAGADIGARDEFGNTPLHAAAAWNQNPAIIAALLDAGAYIGSEDNSGRTPLHDAARTNENPAIITALLDTGADPTERDDDGNTAMDVAKRENRPAGIIAALEGEARVVAESDIAAAPKASAAPSVDCAAWDSNDMESREKFFENITSEEVLACLEAGADSNARGWLEKTPLHAVAELNEDPAVTEALLGAGARVNARDKFDRAPLHFAAGTNRNPAVVAALLDTGADLHARDADKETPLHWAAAHNENLAFTTMLLEAGADLNAREEVGRTPLHSAAGYNENPAVITALLEAGASVNTRNRWGISILHLAARYNKNPAVIATLLDAGADPRATTTSGATALHWAAGFNPNAAVWTAILEAGADPNAQAEDGDTPLHIEATFASHPAVIAALLEAGADPNTPNDDGETPLDIAKDFGADASVIAALEEGARNVDEADSAAAREAPATPSVDCAGWISNERERLRDFYGGITPEDVLACLRAGADPNAELPVQRYRPLHMAAAFNTGPAVITALVNAGADLNAASENGVMPLHAAAIWNTNPDIVETLVGAGADPNAGDPLQSLTALHSAAKFNRNTAILQTLLDAGADPNARGRDDITPLHRAAAHNPNPDVIEALLRAGADPTAQDVAGRTPLEVAKEQGSPAEIVAALKGATPDCQGWMTNDEGLSRTFYENVTPDKAKDCLQAGFDPSMRGLLDATPLHVASYYTKIPEVIAVLVDAGADINARSQGGLGALHFAAMWNTSPAVIGALVDAGADPRAQDDKGRTPLDFAKKRRRPADIIAALEDAVRAAESAIVLSPMKPGGTAEVVVGGIADWLERQVGSGALRFALAAPIRAEEEGDDTVTVHFPGARLVERDGGYAYALGNIALEVTAEDDTAYEFETALPPAVEMTTGSGSADGRITVDHSEISGVWRSDLETASRLDAAASGLRVTDERGRETAGVRGLTLSSTVDRGSDRLWEGEARATLSDLRIAPDLADEGVRLGSLAIAMTVEDSELDPFKVSIPTAATGDGSEVEALGQTMEGFLQGRLGRIELEVALRDLVSMDGGEVAFEIGGLDWLLVLDDRNELADLAMRIEAAEPRLHEQLTRAFSADLIPGSATVDIALERFPLRRIAGRLQELMASGSTARQGTPEQLASSEMAETGTSLEIRTIHVVAPAFGIEAEGQLRIEAGSLFGAVGDMDIRLQGIGNVMRWAAAQGETETVDSLVYLQGLGRPVISEGGDTLTYAYEVDVPRDGAVTVNDIPLDSLLKRLGVSM